MVIDGVISLLKGQLNGTNQSSYTAKIAALVALTAGRIHKVELPRGFSFPAIAVHRYGDAQENDLLGLVEVREDQIQLDVFGNTPADVEATYQAARALMNGYTGTLPDGTVVTLCQLQRGMDLPFLANADAKGVANRAVLGFRVITKTS